MNDPVNFDEKSARRIAAATRVVESMPGFSGLTGTQGIRAIHALAKITSISGAQVEAAEATLSGGTFASLTGGRSWTAAGLGAATLISAAEAPQVGDPVLILPVGDGSGGYSWVAVHYAPTAIKWGQVTWDGTALKQKKYTLNATTLLYDETTETIDTAAACP